MSIALTKENKEIIKEYEWLVSSESIKVEKMFGVILPESMGGYNLKVYMGVYRRELPVKVVEDDGIVYIGYDLSGVFEFVEKDTFDNIKKQVRAAIFHVMSDWYDKNKIISTMGYTKKELEAVTLKPEDIPYTYEDVLRDSKLIYKSDAYRKALSCAKDIMINGGVSIKYKKGKVKYLKGESIYPVLLLDFENEMSGFFDFSNTNVRDMLLPVKPSEIWKERKKLNSSHRQAIGVFVDKSRDFELFDYHVIYKGKKLSKTEDEHFMF